MPSSQPITDESDGPRRWGCTPGAVAVGCSAVLLVVIAVLTVAGVVAYWLWTSEPAYWQAQQQERAQMSRQELEALAQSLENRLPRELTYPRSMYAYRGGGGAGDAPGGGAVGGAPEVGSGSASGTVGDTDGEDIRRITLTFDEINAWLTTRLDEWLANQGRSLPPEVSDPMVAEEAGQLVVAFRYDTPDVQQVVSLVLDLQMQGDGKARLEVAEVRGGNLPIPLESIVSQLREDPAYASEGADLARVARALEGQVFDPVQEIDGSRRVRLLHFEIRPHEVEAVVRVEER